MSLKTQPVKKERLIKFYRTVRPFGLWKKVQRQSGLSAQELASKSENGWIAILNVFIAMGAISGLYLSPMFLVGHWYGKSIFWFVVVLISVVILKFTWYENLPLADLNKNDNPQRC